MNNMTMKVTGDKLVVTIDLSKEVGPSKSGKTIIVAGTGGNANIEGHDGFKIGVNVYKYNDK